MRDNRSSAAAEPARGLAIVRGAGEGVPIVGAATRLTLTVEEAAALIGISRAQAYRCVRSGQLRAVQLGRRIVVPVVAVEQLLGTAIGPGAADFTTDCDTGPGGDGSGAKPGA
jgi:excisionase family DNA binding protein